MVRRHLAGFERTRLETTGIAGGPEPGRPPRLPGRPRPIAVEPDVLAYIVEIGRATRRSSDLQLGSSVRGPLALALGARALAALRGGRT